MLLTCWWLYFNARLGGSVVISCLWIIAFQYKLTMLQKKSLNIGLWNLLRNKNIVCVISYGQQNSFRPANIFYVCCSNALHHKDCAVLFHIRWICWVFVLLWMCLSCTSNGTTMLLDCCISLPSSCDWLITQLLIKLNFGCGCFATRKSQPSWWSLSFHSKPLLRMKKKSN